MLALLAILAAGLFSPPAMPAQLQPAILRTEPFEQMKRAQDAALLQAPDADLSRFYSNGELERFHAYRRPRWIRGLADLAIQGALFFFLIARRGGLRIFAACERLQARLSLAMQRRSQPLQAIERALDRLWGDASWPAAIFFALVLAALANAILWPTSLCFDWLMPRLQGLSDQSIFRWLFLELLELCTQALGMSALAFGLWGLMRRVKRVWLFLGVPAGILVAVAGLADPLSVKMRSQLVALEPGPSRAAIEQVLARSGLAAGEIDRIDAKRDTLMLDAFVVGQGPARRIVLFDTLLESLQPNELAAVVAHELGHTGDRSRLLRAALAGMAVPILLALLPIFLRRAASRGRFGWTSPEDIRALPLVLGAAWLLLVGATPIANQFSQGRELRADLFALDLTRDPESLRSALVKLGRKNQLDPAPPRFVKGLLYDHPTLAHRLGLVDAWERLARDGER